MTAAAAAGDASAGSLILLLLKVSTGVGVAVARTGGGGEQGATAAAAAGISCASAVDAACSPPYVRLLPAASTALLTELIAVLRLHSACCSTATACCLVTELATACATREAGLLAAAPGCCLFFSSLWPWTRSVQTILARDALLRLPAP
ncbi:hypothetical protein COO60DRAFT_1112542 [Scenedesmus sp. NREL 46B-D3]|nr:hypothetical protein COO60DRAFT_1112542 [Scenedesmus sp. NREL 46B-D3]